MKKLILVGLLISAFTLTGCETSKPKICTTVYPIQYAVERIGDSYIETCNISSNTAIQIASIKKDYEKKLENSNALFYISGLEPYFDMYSEEIRGSKSNYLDLSSQGYFYPFQRHTKTLVNGELTSVPSPYYEGDIFNGIDMYKNDPLLWMDPMMMISASEMIKDYLVDQYPDKKELFESNYEKLEIDLTKLDADYQRLKDTDRNISFVSITPSFGNWQTAFGINVYPVVLSKYGALPNDAQLEIIKQRIRDDGVQYIAHEQNLNAEMEELYASLVEELDLIPIELSNVSSLNETEINKNKDYLTIMYENLNVLESIGN